MDISDNMVTDQDLLDILDNADESSKSDLEKAMEKSDKDDANEKLEQLKNIANQLTMSNVGKNPGSGDLDTDLSNWFEGKDSLPSDDLNNYTSNSLAKMDYGLTRNVLSSYSIMGKLRKFIEEDAFDVVFSEQAILGCDTEEVMDRMKAAFVMYKDLANLNAKINNDIKNYRIRSNTETNDIDKLSLLLGSISSDKLQSILSEIAYNKKEDGFASNGSKVI